MGQICSKDEQVSNEQNYKPQISIDTNDCQIYNNLNHTKSKLSDFQTIKPLGQGGYGKVFLTMHQKTQKLYAMKTLSKLNVNKQSQQRHIEDERQILEKVNSQFIVKLRFAFQTPRKLILIIDYVDGGELFQQLKIFKKFSEQVTRFYAIEILLALEYLHSQNIIYRDLKPENVLLDSCGHIKLTDFGLSKFFNQDTRAHSMCGTPEYIAPEILISSSGYDKLCDWWSYGCMIYEMLVGMPPFYSNNKKQMLKDRISKSIPYPSNLSSSALSFLNGLLQVDPKNRLGKDGTEQIKNHEFFNEIDWGKYQRQEVQAPREILIGILSQIQNNDIYASTIKESSSFMDNQQQLYKQNYTDFTFDQEVIQNFSIRKNID